MFTYFELSTLSNFRNWLNSLNRVANLIFLGRLIHIRKCFIVNSLFEEMSNYLLFDALSLIAMYSVIQTITSIQRC